MTRCLEEKGLHRLAYVDRAIVPHADCGHHGTSVFERGAEVGSDRNEHSLDLSEFDAERMHGPAGCFQSGV